MKSLVSKMPLLFLGATLAHAAEERLGTDSLADADPGARLGDRPSPATPPLPPKEVTTAKRKESRYDRDV